MRDYFPCQLIKTADLDPSGRYIFCFAPHGVLTLSAWVCFDTEATGFAAKYPGIDVHPLTLEINFRLPFIREFLLAFGICDASRSSIKRILGKAPGSAVLLALGGAQVQVLQLAQAVSESGLCAVKTPRLSSASANSHAQMSPFSCTWRLGSC